jgi:hypothetical protein
MPPEDAAAVTFELTLDDYRALQQHLCRPARRPLWHYPLLVVTVFVLVFVALSSLPSPESFFVGLFGGLVFVAGYSMLVAWHTRVATDPMPNAAFLCRQEYSFVDEGLRHRTPHREGVTRWSGILRVDETERYLFLMFDRAAGYAIPKRAFASPADAASFSNRVRAQLARR